MESPAPHALGGSLVGSATMKASDRQAIVDLRLASICPAAFFPGCCNETLIPWFPDRLSHDMSGTVPILGSWAVPCPHLGWQLI